jgi:hypothetical protein
LTELGFLHSGGRQAMKKDPSVDIHKERDLLDDLWVHVQGESFVDVQNLKTFLFGILGVKLPWMLLDECNPNIMAVDKSHPPVPRNKTIVHHRSEHYDSGNKGFSTLNLFGANPLQNTLSSALQNFEFEKKHKNQISGSEIFSTKLGETVGTITDKGVFVFKSNVEIRKVNMHYKLLADNRAKRIRTQKLDESIRKTEEKVLKPKIDHQKYLK